MKRSAAILTLLAGVGLSANASAQSSLDNDVRCLATAYYMHATDPEDSDEGLPPLYYFLGRVQLQLSPEDLAKRLPPILERLDPGTKEGLAEIERCAAAYVAASDAFKLVLESPMTPSSTE